ncbi:expressed unknown protein [Seminavis robusta]|uniref:Uncharacterized protein n=1 Tax=Seminavis robusta TaxID=568900 RepID=A0A9N8HCT3_9STRA|nr:expressed unknown protein [Seminavis robusta]|eukprot:Sro232_g093861.1  (107) ;mRNA; f:38739-39059
MTAISYDTNFFFWIYRRMATTKLNLLHAGRSFRLLSDGSSSQRSSFVPHPSACTCTSSDRSEGGPLPPSRKREAFGSPSSSELHKEQIHIQCTRGCSMGLEALVVR